MDNDVLNQAQIDDLIASVSNISVSASSYNSSPKQSVFISTDYNSKLSFLKPYLKKPLNQCTIYTEDNQEFIAVEDLKNCFIKISTIRRRLR